MKKQQKGIILLVVFGGSLLFWATAASLPGITPEDPNEKITVTETPMDNYPDVQRVQFCSSSEFAKSNSYVTEYKIPTACTQPLAIVTDPDGNVWFAQTNTGKLGKFNPLSETFVEYDNPKWPQGGRSMMWGIDYSPDGSIWFTDEANDSLWKFSIQDENYERTQFPRVLESLPQRLSVEGSKIIVNDFTGNKLTFLDPTKTGEGTAYLSIPSPVEGSVTGGFGVDADDNVWYTNWIFQTGGVLVKLNQSKIFEQSNLLAENVTALFDVLDIYQFPLGMTTPNGVSADSEGKIWIVDTSSSFFFKFDPDTESYTRYITSIPHESSYGNSSGLIKAPISRPYWSEFDDKGRLVFNEQTANRIGVFDPVKESLVEYSVPSKNPNWADCEAMEDCGLAQVFDLAVDGDTIWFTEWVENNIGKIDSSKPLPFNVDLDKEKIILKTGEQAQLRLQLTPNNDINFGNAEIISSNTAKFTDIQIQAETKNISQEELANQITILITISASESAIPDVHKVLVGAQTDDVTVSKYLTVIIER